MSKGPKRPPLHWKIETFARHRAGATYLDAAIAAQDRLAKLRDEYANVPASYRGYLSVGICSCLESHMKYSYGAAAERFAQHPHLLRALFKDVSVDIDTLIATTSKSFHLADVVVASMTVSSLETYLDCASHFFSVLMQKHHDFPWDYIRMAMSDDPDTNAEFAAKIARLKRVFDARHKFVHETNVIGESFYSEVLNEDPADCVGDAMWLISQFVRQFEHVEMAPMYAVIRDDEGLNDAVDRTANDLDGLFKAVRDNCDPVQFDALDRFQRAFNDYLWARCEFEASIFVFQRSEAAMSYFLDLAPEYKSYLQGLGPKQRFALSRHPIAEQLAEMDMEWDSDAQAIMVRDPSNYRQK